MAYLSCSAQGSVLGLLLVLTAGCGDVPLQASKQVTPRQTAKAPAAPQVTKRPLPERRNTPGPRNTVAETDSLPVGGPEAQAVKKIGGLIQQSVDLGPTLAIWIFD